MEGAKKDYPSTKFPRWRNKSDWNYFSQRKVLSATRCLEGAWLEVRYVQARVLKVISQPGFIVTSRAARPCGAGQTAQECAPRLLHQPLELKALIIGDNAMERLVQTRFG